MAILLANADGTVYHRYGGRTYLSPMNIDSLVEIMEEGKVTHLEYSRNPAPPPKQTPQYLPKLINEDLRGQIAPVFGCFHCHYAREANQHLALQAGTWSPDQFWIFPLPKQLGLVMDQENQSVINQVMRDSPADLAGIAPGDVLTSLEGKRTLTKYDIQWVLEKKAADAGTIQYSLTREGQPVEGTLALPTGWKVGDPADYLWRVQNVYTEHMIKFLPTPGFIGNRLKSEELSALGIADHPFAIRISQLNFGTHLAGIRMGDIILKAGNRSDFDSVRDFYAWCESLRKADRDIKMQLLRQGSEMNVMVSLNYLNNPEVEKAPRATPGFIVQQLPGDDGIRIGHVTDNCSAERSGLLHGDRIVSVEGESVRTFDHFKEILYNKSPGEILTMEVNRGAKLLQFGFILSGEDERMSDLARLSEKVSAAGQELTCAITIKLPPEKHLFSVHQRGFGQPTLLGFRGSGYRLVGDIKEPSPRKIEQAEGLEPMWVQEGQVRFEQTIEVTDPANFHLLVHVYAQVCDDRRCHEFRSIVGNNGSSETFTEFRGNFERQSIVPKVEASKAKE